MLEQYEDYWREAECYVHVPSNYVSCVLTRRRPPIKGYLIVPVCAQAPGPDNYRDRSKQSPKPDYECKCSAGLCQQLFVLIFPSDPELGHAHHLFARAPLEYSDFSRLPKNADGRVTLEYVHGGSEGRLTGCHKRGNDQGGQGRSERTGGS